jgi:hypothetical protein
VLQKKGEDGSMLAFRGVKKAQVVAGLKISQAAMQRALIHGWAVVEPNNLKYLSLADLFLFAYRLLGRNEYFPV